MKLSRASHYALLALTHIAQQGDKATVSSDKIAEARNLPERFLLKVLQPLVEKSLLHSHKGPSGGYELARSAGDITLLDIIEAADKTAIDGQIPTPYVPKDKKKKKKKADPQAEKANAPVNTKLQKVCEENAEVVRTHLKSVSLSDLANLKKAK